MPGHYENFGIGLSLVSFIALKSRLSVHLLVCIDADTIFGSVLCHFHFSFPAVSSVTPVYTGSSQSRKFCNCFCTFHTAPPNTARPQKLQEDAQFYDIFYLELSILYDLYGQNNIPSCTTLASILRIWWSYEVGISGHELWDIHIPLLLRSSFRSVVLLPPVLYLLRLPWNVLLRGVLTSEKETKSATFWRLRCFLFYVTSVAALIACQKENLKIIYCSRLQAILWTFIIRFR